MTHYELSIYTHTHCKMLSYKPSVMHGEKKIAIVFIAIFPLYHVMMRSNKGERKKTNQNNL